MILFYHHGVLFYVCCLKNCADEEYDFFVDIQNRCYIILKMCYTIISAFGLVQINNDVTIASVDRGNSSGTGLDEMTE